MAKSIVDNLKAELAKAKKAEDKLEAQYAAKVLSQLEWAARLDVAKRSVVGIQAALATISGEVPLVHTETPKSPSAAVYEPTAPPVPKVTGPKCVGCGHIGEMGQIRPFPGAPVVAACMKCNAQQF